MPLDHYVTLGRSGLRVSPFALGAMTFGEDPGGAGCSVEESEKILGDLPRPRRELRRHRQLLHQRSLGEDPRRLLRRRPGLRDRVVLASKFFANMFPGDPNGGGAGRSSIIAQLDESLRRLRTDHLDLYWLHNWDRNTPIEETMRTLDDLVRAGQDPLHRVLQHPGLGHGAGSHHGAAQGLDPADRAAGRVLAAGPHGRGRAGPAGARPGDGARPVEPAEERLPVRQVPARHRVGDSARTAFVGGPERGRSTGSSTPSPRSPTSSAPRRRRSPWPGCAPVRAPWCRSWARAGSAISSRISRASTSPSPPSMSARSTSCPRRPWTTPRRCTAPCGRCSSSPAPPSTGSPQPSTRR